MENKCVFEINAQANKFQVAQAFKAHYNLEAQSVNIVNLGPKYRTMGRKGTVQKRAPRKKAIITYDKGVTFNFNDFK